MHSRNEESHLDLLSEYLFYLSIHTAWQLPNISGHFRADTVKNIIREFPSILASKFDWSYSYYPLPSRLLLFSPRSVQPRSQKHSS